MQNFILDKLAALFEDHLKCTAVLYPEIRQFSFRSVELDAIYTDYENLCQKMRVHFIKSIRYISSNKNNKAKKELNTYLRLFREGRKKFTSVTFDSMFKTKHIMDEHEKNIKNVLAGL